MHKKVDKAAHDDLYSDRVSPLASAGGPEEYIQRYEAKNLIPFYQGGSTKGYVRGLAVKKLSEASSFSGRAPSVSTVLEAGCGQGELSVYLAAKGFNVIGIDISPVACGHATWLAKRIGVESRCLFYAEDLSKLTIPEKSVDYIIGHASLHHFIKYENVPAEFFRVLKSGGRGFFADSYGENKIYHLFHDKEKMYRLGDISLTKRLIRQYFKIILRFT